MKKIIILVSAFVLVSCTREGGEKSDPDFFAFEIKETEPFVLDLDPETSFTSTQIAILDSGDVSKLAVLNGASNSIKIFDLVSRKTIKTIPFELQGPNAISSPMGVFCYNNQYFIYEFYPNTLTSINDKGEVQFKYKTKPESFALSGQLPTGLSPVTITDEYIYISNQGSILQDGTIHHNDPTIVRVNKRDSSINTFMPYPKIYKNNFVTGGKQSIIATSYNSNDKSLIISFPLDHFIYKLTEQGEVISYPSKSSLFDAFDGHFYRSRKRVSNSNFEQTNEKYLGNYSYSAISYDRFRNCYYRIVNIPLSANQLNLKAPQESRYRKYQIIVFDSNFNKIAESKELESVNFTMKSAAFFSSKLGFHVYSKNQNNEDQMRFETFVLKEKE